MEGIIINQMEGGGCMYLRAKSIAIRERRRKLGYTQADVAKAAGIGPMSLNRMNVF